MVFPFKFAAGIECGISRFVIAYAVFDVRGLTLGYQNHQHVVPIAKESILHVLNILEIGQSQHETFQTLLNELSMNNILHGSDKNTDR
jgi:hypothetical protein